jgi:amino acid permease
VVDCINITLTSYGFIINLFPISRQLKEYNNANIIKAVLIALTFCFLVYISLTVLAMNLYGTHIQQSIFDNMRSDKGVLTKGVRLLFLLIFCCNIPYLFYPAKLSILNALQEYRLKCFSRAIEKKILTGVAEPTMDVINETDTRTYTLVCVSFGFSAILSSIFIDDLTLVFGFIAAFSETMLNFVFPGLVYFYAVKK